MKGSNYESGLEPWIDPAHEARVVAWVLGEASEFEVAELERLVAENPELGLFKRRIEAVHGLLGEAVQPDAEPWGLAPERRAALAAALGSEPAPAVVVRPSGGSARKVLLMMAACALGSLVMVKLLGPREPLADQIANHGVGGDRPAPVGGEAGVSPAESASLGEIAASMPAPEAGESAPEAGMAFSGPADGGDDVGDGAAVAMLDLDADEEAAEETRSMVAQESGEPVDGAKHPIARSKAAAARPKGVAEGAGIAAGEAEGVGHAKGAGAPTDPIEATAFAEADARPMVMSMGARGGMALGAPGTWGDGSAANQAVVGGKVGEFSAAQRPVSTFVVRVPAGGLRERAAAVMNAAPQGELGPGGVKVEEFYNSFNYADPAPAAGELGIRIEQAAHPYLPQRNVMRIAVNGSGAAGGHAEAKIGVQVRFNPHRVAQYRLVGYEQQAVAMAEADNLGGVDAAGVAASGGVAVYEVEVLSAGAGDLGTVTASVGNPGTGVVVERSQPLPYLPSPPAFAQAPAPLQLAATAAAVAETLRGGTQAARVNLNKLIPAAEGLRRNYPNDPQVASLLEALFRLAR